MEEGRWLNGRSRSRRQTTRWRTLAIESSWTRLQQIEIDQRRTKSADQTRREVRKVRQGMLSISPTDIISVECPFFTSNMLWNPINFATQTICSRDRLNRCFTAKKWRQCHRSSSWIIEIEWAKSKGFLTRRTFEWPMEQMSRSSPLPYFDSIRWTASSFLNSRAPKKDENSPKISPAILSATSEDEWIPTVISIKLNSFGIE